MLKEVRAVDLLELDCTPWVEKLGVSWRRKTLLPRMPCFSRRKAAMLRDIPRRIFKPQTQTYMCPRLRQFSKQIFLCSRPGRSGSRWVAVGRCLRSWILAPDTGAFVLSTIFARTQTSWCKTSVPRYRHRMKALGLQWNHSCERDLGHGASHCPVCLWLEGSRGDWQGRRAFPFCVLCVF